MYLLLLLSSKYCQMLKRLKRIISLRTRCARGFCCCRFPGGARAGIKTAMEFWGGVGAVERSEQSPALALLSRGSSSPGSWIGWRWKRWEKGRMWPLGTWGTGGRGSAGEWLGSMSSEGFSNINPSMIPWKCPEPRLWALSRCFPVQLFQPLWQERVGRFSTSPGRLLGKVFVLSRGCWPGCSCCSSGMGFAVSSGHGRCHTPLSPVPAPFAGPCATEGPQQPQSPRCDRARVPCPSPG